MSAATARYEQDLENASAATTLHIAAAEILKRKGSPLAATPDFVRRLEGDPRLLTALALHYLTECHATKLPASFSACCVLQLRL